MYLPIFLSSIKAGFPSPADDYIDKSIDLNEELISHPSSTYLARVSGDSMRDIGIFPNDILIVDKSLTPKIRDIVVASIDGEFLVKRYIKRGNQIILRSENSNYKDILISTEEFDLCGVVIYSIRKHS